MKRSPKDGAGPITAEEIRLVRHVAGRKPSAAMHLLEYVLERIRDAPQACSVPGDIDGRLAALERDVFRLGDRVGAMRGPVTGEESPLPDGWTWEEGTPTHEESGLSVIKVPEGYRIIDEHGGYRAAEAYTSEGAAIAAAQALLDGVSAPETPPSPRRTIRVLAPGQRVRHPEFAEEMTVSWVTVHAALLHLDCERTGGGIVGDRPERFTPIGPDPKFIEITFPD